MSIEVARGLLLARDGAWLSESGMKWLRAVALYSCASGDER
jgi:hypothetical protein